MPRYRALLLLLLALPALIAVPMAHAGPDGQVVLDTCMANPDRCAISVAHLTQGWERHYNADRLQVTASTYKTFMLLAYADAVTRGVLDPDTIIKREEWARRWAGFDGGAFVNAYNRLGQPNEVTLDQMVRAMMRESDNQTPDYLLGVLGDVAADRSIKRYVPGFHDVPRSINGAFALWSNNPDEPNSGNRIAEEYRGYENHGFREELDDVFTRLDDPAFVLGLRVGRCVDLPWQDFPCSPNFMTTLPNRAKNADTKLMRSTTRSYVRVMKGLLDGSVFPNRMGEVMSRHLEWWLELPDFSAAFSRYGAKGGSLFANDLLTWTTFLENRATGDQVAVAVFTNRLGLTGTQVRRFAQDIALDPAFAALVAQVIPDDPQLPELALRTTTIPAASSGAALEVRAQLDNTSPFRMHAPVWVSLYVSEDNVLDAGDTKVDSIKVPALAAYGSRQLRLRTKAVPAASRYVLIVVDETDEVAEADEGNNLVWERIR